MENYFEMLQQKILLAENVERINQIKAKEQESKKVDCFCKDFSALIANQMDEMLKTGKTDIKGKLDSQDNLATSGYSGVRVEWEKDPSLCHSVITEMLIRRYGAKTVKFGNNERIASYYRSGDSVNGIKCSIPYYGVSIGIPNKDVNVYYGTTNPFNEAGF